MPSGCHSRGNVKSGEGPAVPAINTRNSENTQKKNTTCLHRTATDNSIKKGANELIDSCDSLLCVANSEVKLNSPFFLPFLVH